MNIKKIINVGLSALNEHKPEIMLTIGVAGMIVAPVMAIKNSKKNNEEVSLINKELNDMEIGEGPLEFNDKQEAKKYRFVLYRDLAKAYAKTYAVPALLEGASVVLIFSSNRIMRKRLATMTASYISVATMFEEYRQRVKEKYGEEAERKIRLNEQTEEIEEITLDKNGKEITKKKKVIVADAMPADPHTFFFNEVTSDNWSTNMDQNFMFLRARMNQDNWELQSGENFGKPVLWLSKVLDSILKNEVPYTKNMGWSFNEGGEDFVDYGCFELGQDNNPIAFKRDAIRYVKYPNIDKPIKTVVLTFNDEGTKVYNKALKIYNREIELRGELVDEKVN